MFARKRKNEMFVVKSSLVVEASPKLIAQIELNLDAAWINVF
jgi:hypothetical protein